MLNKLKKIILKRLWLRESWVIFFVMGIIMMNYPFISIFNKPVVVFQIPLLYVYLQWGWLISIFVIFLFSKAANTKDDNNTGENP